MYVTPDDILKIVLFSPQKKTQQQKLYAEICVVNRLQCRGFYEGNKKIKLNMVSSVDLCFVKHCFLFICFNEVQNQRIMLGTETEKKKHLINKKKML